jgi:hypothetical protein
MTDETIMLKLPRSEALALDAFVNNSAERLFCVRGGKDECAQELGSLETACDKLHAAVMPPNDVEQLPPSSHRDPCPLVA